MRPTVECMLMTPKNNSADVRENNIDVKLVFLVGGSITNCLEFMSSVLAQKKCVVYLYN